MIKCEASLIHALHTIMLRVHNNILMKLQILNNKSLKAGKYYKKVYPLLRTYGTLLLAFFIFYQPFAPDGASFN